MQPWEGDACCWSTPAGTRVTAKALAGAVSPADAEGGARESDLVFLVLDAVESRRWTRSSSGIMRPFSDKVLLVVNKVDSPDRDPLVWNAHAHGFPNVIGVSAAHGRSIDRLKETVAGASRGAAGGAAGRGALPPAAARRAARRKTRSCASRSSASRIRANPVSPTASSARSARSCPPFRDDAGHRRGNLHPQGPKLRILDTAGIRRKSRVTDPVEYYSVNRAIESIGRADVVFLMMDASRGLVDQDKKIAAQAVKEGRGVVLVPGKWDLQRDTAKLRETVREIVRFQFPVLGFAPIVPVSALTGYGVRALLDTARRRLGAAARAGGHRPAEPGPGVVARALQASRAGKNYKIRFMTQVSANPVRFVAFVNRKSGFPDGLRAVPGELHPPGPRFHPRARVRRVHGRAGRRLDEGVEHRRSGAAPRGQAARAPLLGKRAPAPLPEEGAQRAPRVFGQRGPVVDALPPPAVRPQVHHRRRKEADVGGPGLRDPDIAARFAAHPLGPDRGPDDDAPRRGRCDTRERHGARRRTGQGGGNGPGAPLRFLGEEARGHAAEVDRRPVVAEPGASAGAAAVHRGAGPGGGRHLGDGACTGPLRSPFGEQGRCGGSRGGRGGDPAREDGVSHRRRRTGLPSRVRRPQGHVPRHAPPQAHPLCPFCGKAPGRPAPVRGRHPMADHDESPEPRRHAGVFRVGGVVRPWTRDGPPLPAGKPSLLFPEGRLLMAPDGGLFFNPNGHGGVIEALRRFRRFAAMGSQRCGAPVLFPGGQSAGQRPRPCFSRLPLPRPRAQISAKVVEKAYPEEKLGIIVDGGREDRVIEYSDLDEERMHARGPDGRLYYGQGSIAIHILDVPFLESPALLLPWHLARKKAKTLNPVRPRAPKFRRGTP